MISDCEFLPNKPERGGYVQVGRSKPGRERLAHRRAYVEEFGPIPPGYQVDHECHNQDLSCSGGTLCRHRACVNPKHLRAVPPRDNVLTGRTIAAENSERRVCEQGHAFTEANTYIWNGHRQCRMCKLVDDHRRKERAKAKEWRVFDDILGED